MKILISFSIIIVTTLTADGSSEKSNFIQASSVNKESANDVSLKALLVPSSLCNSKTVSSKCSSRIEVRGWMNANEERETFLLIDEVFDLKEQAHFPLLHPYLIQVSVYEAIASFPLHFEQTVDVSCSENGVQRRATYHEDFPFTSEQLRNYNDLLNSIIYEEEKMKEANAIKSDIQNYVSDRRQDLLLYFDKELENTVPPHTVNVKSAERVPSQRDNARKLNSQKADDFNDDDKIQIQLENLLKSYENTNGGILYRTNQNNGVRFGISGDGLPKAIKLESNANQNFNSDRRNHGKAKIENRFHINQDEESGGSTGAINHHYHGQDIETSKSVPDEIDIRVRFGNSRNSRAASVNAVNQNQLSSLRQYHKSEWMNHKFSFDDNRNISPDSNSAYDNQKQNNRNIYDYYRDDEAKRDKYENRFEPIDVEDDPNMLIQENEYHPIRNHLHTDAFSSMKLQSPNAAQKDAIFKSKFKRDEVEISHRDEINLRVSKEDKKNDEEKKARRYSVYGLNKPTHQRKMKIQIFRMQNQTWIKIHPTIFIANETMVNASNSSNGFSIKSSIRKSFSQTLDRNHAKLLVLNNETSFNSSSIMEYENESREKFADAVEKSICTRNDMMKRSIITLSEAGVVLPNDGRAIMNCPSNVDQLCLNIRERDNAWRLNVVIPFQHNEILDKRSPFVKISNIYIDTSDGINLFTQFEITSMDHFTRQFNLSFANCDILERLNVSHSFTISPNKSKLINMTFPLPFGVDLQDRKCKVNILIGKKVIAQREFLASPKRKRCMCIWLCSCFCFDYFLSNGIKEVCHIMSVKNEIYAGFVDDKNIDEFKSEVEGWKYWRRILMLMPLAIILFVTLMGCIKAILGCCYRRIDSWKFNHVQSCKPYRESSRIWKVIVNILFFYLLPIMWCIKCCYSSDNEKIDSENSFFARSLVRKEMYSDDDYDDEEEDNDGKSEENWKLLKPRAVSSDYSAILEKYKRSSETIFNVTNSRNPFDENQQTDDDETLVKDTEFVVNAINESHESLRKLSHHSEENIENDERFEAAQQLVKEFLAARTVYRHFNQPIGNVQINDSQSYSIRGYFIPAQSTGYQFITYNPIKQFYQVSNSLTLVAIAPQIPLDSKAFRRYYANKIEVLEANDLSLLPSTSAPCINILVQDRSMYGS